MRLIDADALKDWECEKCEYEHKDGYWCRESCGVMQRIDESQTIDAVPRPVLDQIRWERDMAMGQLEEIGVAFCEKADDVVRVVRCKECKHSLENNGLLVIGARYCHRNLDGNDVYEPVWDCDFCSRAERKEVQNGTDWQRQAD